jgi:hypothetical protein
MVTEVDHSGRNNQLFGHSMMHKDFSKLLTRYFMYRQSYLMIYSHVDPIEQLEHVLEKLRLAHHAHTILKRAKFIEKYHGFKI